jgi:hypothetical protein
MQSDGTSSEPHEIVVGRAGRRPLAATDAARGATTVSTPWAIGSLIGVNLVPLAGVLFLGWSTFDLMVLYWFENGIVGLFALLKILLTRGRDGDAVSVGAAFERLFVAGFFMLHYGAFWTVHGLFVVALFGGGAGASGAAFAPMAGPAWFFFGGLGIAGAVLRGGLLLAAMGLLVSHAVSFIGNVLTRGEDLDRPPKELMARPYGRVAVLHVTLVLGAGLMLGLGEPVIGLALFVLLKTVVDLRAHVRSHQPRPAA